VRTSRNNWLHFHSSSILISLRKARSLWIWSLPISLVIHENARPNLCHRVNWWVDGVEGEWVWFDHVQACEFLSFYSNGSTFLRLFAPNYWWFILLYIYNNVYHINLTIFWLQKTSFPIKEILELAMLHARSSKILFQNPQFSTIVECRPACSCQ
jgi:hypothetical protein